MTTPATTEDIKTALHYHELVARTEALLALYDEIRPKVGNFLTHIKNTRYLTRGHVQDLCDDHWVVEEATICLSVAFEHLLEHLRTLGVVPQSFTLPTPPPGTAAAKVRGPVDPKGMRATPIKRSSHDRIDELVKDAERREAMKQADMNASVQL